MSLAGLVKPSGTPFPLPLLQHMPKRIAHCQPERWTKPGLSGWLSTPADMFQSLKANHEEPDPIAAAAVGVPEAEGGTGAVAGAGAGVAESVVNQSAIDLLRRLPGGWDA